MSAVANLTDQDDRIRIERALDETLFVEAGAGTGKTHQLVERIVNLVASGRAGGDGIAAITFTDKAAAELRDRILERLEVESDNPEDSERRNRCRAALEDLDGAAIETIHAFAARILSLYPLEARLPPGFEITDDTEAKVELDERWRDQLDEMLSSPELAIPMRAAFDAGLSLDHLARLARHLHGDWDRAQSAESHMEEGCVDIAAFVSDLRSVIRQCGACSNPKDRLYQRLQDLESFADQLSQAADDPGALAGLLELSTDTSLRVGNKGAKANWIGNALVEIRDAMAGLHDRREALRLDVVRCICAPIYNAVRKFVLDYADERRRRGRLVFHDLLVHCHTLLSDNPAVAASVRERFRYLLIDEFQDTDPLQTQIVDAIAGKEEGRLFFVGDPKQSIYRFRRADIEQYTAVRERYADSRVHLTQNFRSLPGVTDFVNAVFRPLMQADSSGGQADWEDLSATRQPLEDGQTSATIVVGDEIDELTPAVRLAEARAIAEVIADVRRSKWSVLDQIEKNWRPASYSDIAVLVPARTGLSQLVPELDQQNIPYRLESRSLVYDTEEVCRLLGILQAIEDPTDEIALIGSLRSPAFACSDQDLFGWREAGGRWDYREEIPAGILAGHPVAEAMRWLQSTAAWRWHVSVSVLVEYVIRKRRLMELAVVDRRPRDRWQRLRFILDQARDFCDRGGRTLGEFLDWAQRQADQDTRVVESLVPESDHDAVRILTMHAAKGLEFPVVVLAGLNVQPRDERPILIWSVSDAPELFFRKGLETPGYSDLYRRAARMQRSERLRLNYVAATRARDHLVVSLYRKAGNNVNSDAHIIAKRVDELSSGPDVPFVRKVAHEPIPQQSHSPGGVTRVSEAHASELQQPKDAAAIRKQWIDERDAAFCSPAHFDVQSATSIARRVHLDDANLRKEEVHDDLPPWRRGRAGTSIGRAVHSALQTINIEDADDAEVNAVARAQSAAEGLTQRGSADVARLIHVALASPSLRDAVASGRYWREVYVAASIPDAQGRETLVEGFVDLMYQTSEGDLVVVDYKTDALRDGEAAVQALARYELQGGAYALVLEASLGMRVAACRFLFLHANEEQSVPNLAAAATRVREVLCRPDPE